MQWTMALFAAAAVATGAASMEAGRSVSDAKADALMAQYRAASGGAALDRHDAFHETGTVLRDGHAGTYEMYGDLHTLRTAGVHTLDGKYSGGGFDGTVAWGIEPDGKVKRFTDPTMLRAERTSAYLTLSAFNWPDRFPARFAYVGPKTYEGRAFEVVRVTPEGADPADLWLDAKTHLLERISVDAPEPGYADILENRTIDGVVIGFKSNQVEKDHNMVQTLATFDFVPLDPARLTPAYYSTEAR
jgi:hypothetical protein